MEWNDYQYDLIQRAFCSCFSPTLLLDFSQTSHFAKPDQVSSLHHP